MATFVATLIAIVLAVGLVLLMRRIRATRSMLARVPAAALTVPGVRSDQVVGV